MSLLRIFGIGRKRKPREEAYDDPPDGLALAREQMLNRMRARADAPPPEPPSAPDTPGGAAPEPVPVAPAQTDPLAGLGTEDPQSGGEGAGASPGLDSDLLDVFRDVKEEVDESSLASQLEDIPISDLLGDVVGISSRLGVKAPRRQEPSQLVRKVVIEPEPAAEPEAGVAEEEEPPMPTVRQVLPGDAPADGDPGASLAAPCDDDYAGPRDLPGQRYILHVLFLALTLAMAAGLGVRGAYTDAFAGDVQATPAVLAYLSPPVVPPQPEPVNIGDQDIEALQKHTAASPTPSPTPLPTPAPDPEARARSYGFIMGQPAWFRYAIQSGDSLSSIAEAFGICPDHILWNNPGRKEEDRLIVGDEMLLPGYRGVVYRMQQGDTLADVAARYSTTVDMVLAYPGNQLNTADDARPGTVVLLPDAIPPSALLQDADAQWAYTHPSADGYVWPFYGPITTYYGEVRPGYVHNAIDIGGLGHFGAPVLAAAAGTVDKVEDLFGGLGRYVVISHGDGSRTVYGHMSDVYVQAGDHVQQGEPVGALGCTGHSTGTHLHFELWINGAPVDPLAYLP